MCSLLSSDRVEAFHRTQEGGSIISTTGVNLASQCGHLEEGDGQHSRRNYLLVGLRYNTLNKNLPPTGSVLIA